MMNQPVRMAQTFHTSLGGTCSKQRIELGLIALISLLYGFLSSSTPDSFGVTELMIAVLLFGLVGVRRPLAVLDVQGNSAAPSLMKLVAVYLLFVPTIVGVIIHQNKMIDFVRDIIPFLYMLMPVFLYSRIRKFPELWVKGLAIGLFLSGVGFTFQYCSDPLVEMKHLATLQMLGSNRDNPWQDPAAVFTFSFSLLMAMHFVFNAKYFLAVVFGMIFLTMFGMYLSTVTRAPVGLAIITLLLFICLKFLRWRFSNGSEKGRMIVGLLAFSAVVAIVIFISRDMLQAGLTMLIQKTEAVGVSNARGVEIQAVLAHVSEKPFVLLFGEGWGGLLSNPIGGGAQWSFVHNSFAYFLFKTGIFGLVAYLVFLVWCLSGLRYLFIRRESDDFLNVILVSSISPLVVACLLEPVFKTLSFGLLLCLMIAVWLAVAKKSLFTASLLR